MPKVRKLAIGDDVKWTAERFARSKSFSELPSEVQRILKRNVRGPQKAPRKASTTIRLSPDVLVALRSTGRGWQGRVDETLRKAFVKS